jgi:arylsulfatase A-like enzyme/Flp pilus assembly protein TadD
MMTSLSRPARKDQPTPRSLRGGSPPRGVRRLRLLALAAAVTILLLSAAAVWWRGARPKPPRAAGLSVLLITVDTLRADSLGAYGRAGALTPWSDRLAAAGVRFDHAHAHNVVTLPSHANILSGRYPLEHGVRDNAGFRFPPGTETLATLLAARGYRTGAFVSAFPLGARFGLARGFEIYDDRFVDARSRPAFLLQERRGVETVALARRWLEAQGSQPWFCWVHVFEPHFPYEPPEPLAARFRDAPYQGEVAATDAALAPLLEPLLAAGERGNTLVVLTADHGESLGEHGEATHGIFAYEATLRVPLVLYQPRLFRPRVVSQPARHVDLLPTILDALAVPAPADLPGRSLLALAAGGSGEPVTSYFEALSGQLNRGWAPLHGVIRERTKYIDLPIPELFDLQSDPREARNLASAQPRQLARGRALLAPLRATDVGRAPSPESAETRERLASLGYVTAATSPAARVYGPDDDPKRLIALDAALRDVVGLYLAGDLPAALARCRELVRLRPGMPSALLHLAQLERESGHLDAAVLALEQALAVNPEDTTVLALLGSYLIQAGRAREAVALLEPAARREPADAEVLRARGLGLAKLGRTEEALATFERARAADPASAAVLVDLGTAHLMARDEARARAAFEAALALNPDTARAHASLGAMAAENGQGEQALEHWRRAVALDARECDKPLALGLLLAQRGRAAEARTYLEFFVDSAPPALYGREIERVRRWLAARAAAGPPGESRHAR